MSEETDNNDSNRPVLIVIGGLLALAFLVAFVVTQAIEDGWGANQLGPIGTWVASLITVIAVIVALSQARLAQSVAHDSRVDQEMRWTDEIRKSEYEAAIQIIESTQAIFNKIASMIEFTEIATQAAEAEAPFELQYMLDRRDNARDTVTLAGSKARMSVALLTHEPMRERAKAIIDVLEQAQVEIQGSAVDGKNWERASATMQAITPATTALVEATDVYAAPAFTLRTHGRTVPTD